VGLIGSKPAENHLEQADLRAKNSHKALFTGVTSYQLNSNQPDNWLANDG
jgi:hypothetical protein